jgi:hypothetical protein
MKLISSLSPNSPFHVLMFTTFQVFSVSPDILYALERFTVRLIFTLFYQTFIGGGKISQYNTTMLFYGKVFVVFLLTFFVFVAAADRHSNVNWAFRKRHAIKDDLYPCNLSIGISTSSNPIPIGSITDLNVSTTLYVSMEQIEVTWTPILNSCQDDFIGIYFVEIPIPTGIYSSLYIIV